MIGNALIITIALLVALVFWFMGELKFFAPYKLVLWREYATPTQTYVALLSVNVLAAAFVFIRKFFLKDTGRKLSHLDKQLHTCGTKVRAACQVREGRAERADSHSGLRNPGPHLSRLRTSEIATMVEVGKFRVIAQEDLTEFAYSSDKGRMRPDVENLIRQGLVKMKSIPHEEKGSRQLLTLTKSGHRLLTENRIAGKDQALYCGFTKPREAHHDAYLYRLYQKAADKIECEGGTETPRSHRLRVEKAGLLRGRTSPCGHRTCHQPLPRTASRGKSPCRIFHLRPCQRHVEPPARSGLT
jgi:hypothetical protein